MPRRSRRDRAKSSAFLDLWDQLDREPTEQEVAQEVAQRLAARYSGWIVTPEQVVLSRRSPKGRPNPYRTRWATVEGQVFVVESDRLDGIWCVADETEERFADDPQAWIEFVKSDAYRKAWVMTLPQAREVIAAWVSGKERAA